MENQMNDASDPNRALLLMLLVLCGRKPKRWHTSREELTLPQGCVLALRYSSR